MATAMTLYWYQLSSGTLAPTYYGQLDATVRELCTENAVTPPSAPWESQLACSLVSTWLTQIDRAVRAVATIVDVPAPATTLTHLDAGQFEAVYWHQLDSCVREIINPTENTVAPAVTPDPAAPGDLLTTTNGTWTGGSGTPAYTYQWWVDGAAVSGATAQTYQTTEAQDGSDVYCVVTNTNATGQVSADSNTVTLAAYEGPLDLVPGAVAAYGQRALSAAMLGQALYTIREDAGDTTQSFNSDAETGAAPVASITTFLNGSDGFVTLWNDQSGNGKNAVQATTADQPAWQATQFGTVPSLVFSSVGTQFLATAGDVDLFAATGGACIFAVINAVFDTSHTAGTICGGNAEEFAGNESNWLAAVGGLNAPDEQTLTFTADGADFDAGVGRSSTASLTFQGANVLVEFQVTTTVGKLLLNGTEVTLGFSNFYGTQPIGAVPWPMAIGANDAAGPASFFNGKIAELLIYPNLSDANRLAIRQNIAAYYGITLS